KEPSYESIARRPLHSNVKQVEKRYPIFTQSFNITIRNAIAHPSYFLHLGEKTIDFTDLKSKDTLTFRDFFEACRSLSSLLMALSSVRNVMMCRQTKIYWEYYKVLKQQKVDS
ncbi:MAG: hypothetical protein ACE5PO_09430, partial [Candidatus Bathyarchaeia archaeon]